MDEHGHHRTGAGLGEPLWAWGLFEVLVSIALVAAAVGYASALVSARRRGPWPRRRVAFWYLGLAAAGGGLVGPVAVAAHASFTWHMVAHLLLGMVSPLLLVRAAPVTLALRALPVRPARGLTRLLRSTWVRVVTHPFVACLLNAEGLWLLYTTSLYPAMHHTALLHALVHAHIFLAGYVFTVSLVGVDPDRTARRCACVLQP